MNIESKVFKKKIIAFKDFFSKIALISSIKVDFTLQMIELMGRNQFGNLIIDILKSHNSSYKSFFLQC
jgi:hypothetical protein